MHSCTSPCQGGWVELHSVQVGSGAETTSGQLYAGTVARLHPAGDRIYGADRGLSPSDIERYDITQGTGTVAYLMEYRRGRISAPSCISSAR